MISDGVIPFSFTLPVDHLYCFLPTFLKLHAAQQMIQLNTFCFGEDFVIWLSPSMFFLSSPLCCSKTHSLSLFYWSIFDLQCCVTFKCTVKWISCTHTYPTVFLRLFSHIGHYRVWSRDPCASSRFFSGIYFMYRNVSVLPSLPVYLSPSLSPNNHKFVLYICDSACFVN